MRWVRAVAAVAVVAGLLITAACGASGHDSRRGTARESAPLGEASGASSRPGATPDGNGALVPENLQVPPTSLAATPGRSGRVTGADLSWPQCPKGMGIVHKRTEGAPLPTAAARFVVIGLTNGPSFTPNPCLADQVAWARARGLPASAYAVVSWPDAATLARYREQGPYDGGARLGALGNAGYQAARYDVGVMREAGLDSPSVWVDVEPVTHFDWRGTPVENAAVVRGAVRGFTASGLRVGVYSTPHLWRSVVGDLRLGVPEWRAAGPTSMAAALRRCRPDWSFGGGRALLGQWIEDHRDRDVTCPGRAAAVAGWFARP